MIAIDLKDQLFATAVVWVIIGFDVARWLGRRDRRARLKRIKAARARRRFWRRSEQRLHPEQIGDIRRSLIRILRDLDNEDDIFDLPAQLSFAAMADFLLARGVTCIPIPGTKPSRFISIWAFEQPERDAIREALSQLEPGEDP